MGKEDTNEIVNAAAATTAEQNSHYTQSHHTSLSSLSSASTSIGSGEMVFHWPTMTNSTSMVSMVDAQFDKLNLDVSTPTVFTSSSSLKMTSSTPNIGELFGKTSSRLREPTARFREDSLSDTLRCVFCLEFTEQLRQLQCLHSICNSCLKGSPKGGDVCPVCTQRSDSAAAASNNGFSSSSVITQTKSTTQNGTTATTHNVSNHVGSVLSILIEDNNTSTPVSTNNYKCHDMKGKVNWSVGDNFMVKENQNQGYQVGGDNEQQNNRTYIMDGGCQNNNSGGGGGRGNMTTNNVAGIDDDINMFNLTSSSSSGNTSENSSECTSCDEKTTAVALCQDCNELMCSRCTCAHGRLKVTKEHKIEYISGLSNISNQKILNGDFSHEPKNNTDIEKSKSGNRKENKILFSPSSDKENEQQSKQNQHQQKHKHQSGQSCSLHRLPLTEVCKECNLLCCNNCKYIQLHKDHTLFNISQLTENAVKARSSVTALVPYFKDAQKMNEDFIQDFEENCKRVEEEIRSYFNDIGNALRERVTFLLQKIDMIRTSSRSASMDKHEFFNCMLEKCHTVLSEPGTEIMISAADETAIMQFINGCSNVVLNAEEVFSATGNVACSLGRMLPAPKRRNVLGLIVNPKVLEVIQSIGEITSNATCSYNCMAAGAGLQKASVGKPANFLIQAFDYLGKKRMTSDDTFHVSLVSTDNQTRQIAEVTVRGDGSYLVTYKPSVPGTFHLNVMLNGSHIMHSPFSLLVTAGRDYRRIDGTRPQFIMGGEGSEDGKFCRPWGVCCDKEGNIYVADRSNNRIQVFDENCQFKLKFGEAGNKFGEFDRPASVAVDEQLKRLVVADKDNHRLQMFTLMGKFIMKVGEKGCGKGQFNYPWDVAVSSNSIILVSDTRNHRIQMFNPQGIFMYEYSLKEKCPMNWQEYFDSPRGVCFTNDNNILITDFNKHRVLNIRSDFQRAQYFGDEGTERGFMKRPQGVCVDDEGNVIVADSRNHRIQVFNSHGGFITTFGEFGVEPGKLDRPSGICLSPKGRIIVVDFGNNRIVGY